MKVSNNCRRCGCDTSDRDSRTLYCGPCAPKRAYEIAKAKGRSKATGQALAIRKVARAVEKGELVPVKTLVCVDCGEPAKHYDHRDYNKPLEVEPVCISCNLLRGPAIPLKAAA